MDFKRFDFPRPAKNNYHPCQSALKVFSHQTNRTGHNNLFFFACTVILLPFGLISLIAVSGGRYNIVSLPSSRTAFFGDLRAPLEELSQQAELAPHTKTKCSHSTSLGSIRKVSFQTPPRFKRLYEAELFWPKIPKRHNRKWDNHVSALFNWCWLKHEIVQKTKVTII